VKRERHNSRVLFSKNRDSAPSANILGLRDLWRSMYAFSPACQRKVSRCRASENKGILNAKAGACFSKSARFGMVRYLPASMRSLLSVVSAAIVVLGGVSRFHATGTIAAHCSFVLREGTVNQTPQIEIEQRKGERRDDQRASQRLNRSCGPSPFNRVTYAECGLRTIRETTCFILTPLESLARCRT
jgi:hypothetical protein